MKNNFVIALSIFFLLLTTACGVNNKHTVSYGGQFETKIEHFASTHVDHKTQVDKLLWNEEGENPTIHGSQKPLTKPVSAKMRKPIRSLAQKRIHWVQNTAYEPKPPKLPMEKHAQAGFWIAIGAYVVPILLQLGFLAAGLDYISAFYIGLGILSFGGMVAAFVLGLVALKILKNEPNKYRGYGKAIAAVVIPSVMFLLTILYMLFVILLFAVLLAIL